jgi:hypothetical protein
MIKAKEKVEWLLRECEELISIFVTSVKTAKMNTQMKEAI